MRSMMSMPGNQWPPAMSISIEDHSSPIEELLWIREAYALQPEGDVPPLLVQTPEAAGEPEDASMWEAARVQLWSAAVQHAGGVIPGERLEALMHTEDASDERLAALLAMHGPSWRDRFGDAALERGYLEWSGRRFDALTQAMQQPLRETPEHRSLAALIAAWEAGLTRIVTIPCRSEHTRVISSSALLMTEETRADPAAYAAALGAF
ncbi:hypothetical protein SAMN04487783_0300 [Agrococcus baldri]|uniref:Uncharacterized protein n=1 Tax=Agrococcus baldri TaxID=153730 RepID=A0AA94KYJ0_9MICO|nr:hypothetical protein [Agrococcus baldri]SFR99023.1 hypothetical protein SAMN04487783_0300 [Agrococcus baldri]